MTVEQIAQEFHINPPRWYFTGPAAPYVYAPDRLHLVEIGPFRYPPVYMSKYDTPGVRGLIDGDESCRVEISPVLLARTTTGEVWIDNPAYIRKSRLDAGLCLTCGIGSAIDGGQCVDCMPF